MSMLAPVHMSSTSPAHKSFTHAVHVYTCRCTCPIHMSCTHAYTHVLYTCPMQHAYALVCAHVYAHEPACMHVHIRLYSCPCTCLCTALPACLCTCPCTFDEGAHPGRGGTSRPVCHARAPGWCRQHRRQYRGGRWETDGAMQTADKWALHSALK